jgi:hypothetical protein
LFRECTRLAGAFIGKALTIETRASASRPQSIRFMKENPLRTSVIGSYPFPGWLEFTCQHLAQFGEADRAEAQDDAVIAALHDQLAAGMDVVTDGEQTRFQFVLLRLSGGHRIGERFATAVRSTGS